MRLDKSLNRANLQRQQLFFIECWSSLASRNNIDTDRVTYNNPLSAVGELIELYALGDKYKAATKRIHVMSELYELLEDDTTLQASEFEGLPRQLLELFQERATDSDRYAVLERKKSLIVSFLYQLQDLLQRHYVSVSVRQLNELLIESNEYNDSVCDRIYYLTNMLISTLLTLGMPLSECYLLYKNYFMKRQETTENVTRDISFQDSFNEFVGKINKGIQLIRISLNLISQRLYTLVGSAGNIIEFKNCKFTLTQSQNAVAVDINVESISYSAARSKAEIDLNNALDVIAYMMNRADITLEKRYVACIFNDQGEPDEIKDLIDFSQDLSNSSDRLSLNEFNLYISTMSRLHNIASKRTVSKVNAAFRFYQNGITNNTPESRFTAFWSALESLTVGVHEEPLTHDEHVILSVLPCIGLDYPVKQLFAFRGVAKDLGWREINTQQINIDFKTANLGEIYKSLKDPNVKTELFQRLNNYPYAKYRFEKFASLCECPYKVGSKIQKHLKKVELQIHRLYRVRNAIVHNASVQDRIEMLVVNLEHYLRGTLNAMVYMMNNAPSISSPEEAFNRYQYKSNTILGQLDPSFPLAERKKEAKMKEINNGNVRLSDEKLVEWLVMHR